MLDAAQMALFAVGDKRTVLLPRDTRGTPEGAVAAFRAAVQEKAGIVLGPLFAVSARAVAPLARDAGIPLITFSNDSTVAETGAFVFGLRPEEQIERVMEHAAREGLRRVALVASDDAYGRRARAAWQRALERFGLDPSSPAEVLGQTEPELDVAMRRISAYEARRAALEQQKAALKARGDEVAQAALAQLGTRETFGPPPFDALLIAEGGLRLRSVVALADYYDVGPPEVRFLGTARWIEEDPRLFELASLRGARFATRDPETMEQFRSEFAKAFGRQPSPLAVLAFDATALALVLARDEGRFARSALTAPEGFIGYGGIVRLRPDGLAEHGLAIVEVTADRLAVVEPAPRRFPAGFATLAPVQAGSTTSSQNRAIASATR